MTRHRAVSPCTVAAYRDTFRLLLLFVEQHIGRAPTAVTLADLDAQLILAFLDHLEHDRGNGVRSRNARLATPPTYPDTLIAVLRGSTGSTGMAWRCSCVAA